MSSIDAVIVGRLFAAKKLVSAAAIAVAAAVLLTTPFYATEYWLEVIIIPFLILSLAGLGLNLLTGYTGQISLGSGAFMMIGAYSTFALQFRLPALPFPFALIASGLVTAAIGIVFGFPSTRIKGFYLIVSTLAAQFFFEWMFVKIPWFYDGNSAATISLPGHIDVFGVDVSSGTGRFYLIISIVVALTWIVHNLVRGQTGRNWMAIRDMDTAAAVIGVQLTRAKLQAFAVSSFILGIAGALWAFAYLGTAGVESFSLNRSYQILFIIIIGGLGTIRGAYFGAAFVRLLPLALEWLFQHLFAGNVDAGLLQNVQKIVFGLLIILFLIKEPEGLARMLRLSTIPSARCRKRNHSPPQA